MDVEDIPPGQNFAQTIEARIADCVAFLAVIGPQWMQTLHDRSKRPEPDYVHHEIRIALQSKATVIPVLVGGATIAHLTDLPEDIRDLSLHQAIEIRDDTFNEDSGRLTKSLVAIPGLEVNTAAGTTRRKALVLRLASAAAIIAALLFSLSYFGLWPWTNSQANRTKIHQLLVTGQAEAGQADYATAFKTYQSALDIDPGNRVAMQRQVDAAMRWARDFHVIAGEGQKAEEIAAPQIAAIISVLEAGLGRAPGAGMRPADILAHLGWAHWLNQRIAYKEFGSAAEKDLRRALNMDPSNVFAHAMLGNVLLDSNRSVDEAIRHFDAALKSGAERPFVRELQLGAMTYDDDPRVRRELVKVANQMRVNSEEMPEEYGHRILSSLYDPTVNSREALVQTLTAVAPEAAWATYVWLAQQDSNDSDGQQLRGEFIRANALELEGNKSEAFVRFTALQKKLKQIGANGRIADQVSEAIKRLSPSTTHAVQVGSLPQL